MSGPPKRKSKSDVPVFPDPEQHIDLIVTRKEIKKLLLQIQETLPKGEDRHKLIMFANVLHPGGFHDPGRLPYDSSTGRSKKNRREDCLLAFVSKLVQDFWWLVLEEKEPPEAPNAIMEDVQVQLDKLHQIAKKGLSQCQVAGDEGKGFELVC